MKTKEENPYFIFDGLLELRDHAAGLSAGELRRLKERIALNAADLGISERTLYRKIREYDLE